MLSIPDSIMQEIFRHVQAAYPEEGAGFLLGQDGEVRQVQEVLRLSNAREAFARHNRYLITSQDMLMAEEAAADHNLDLLGVFHSHPDHPNQPSTFDLEWALPFFSYLITSVEQGRAGQSRSWRLLDDRSAFTEEQVKITEEEKNS